MIQSPFLADRPADHLLGFQPFWQIGRHVTSDGGTSRYYRHFVSLCARCGAPYVVFIADGRPFHPSRRCEAHRKRGLKVREFRISWRVAPMWPPR